MQKHINIIISSLVLLIFLTVTTKVSALQRGKMVGARTDIKDVKTNREVQELGKFSVEEFNKGLQTAQLPSDGFKGGPLKFVEVVEAQKQVVSGLKYYLKIEAMQGVITRTFDAEVVVKPWVHQSKQLLNFRPSSSRLNIVTVPTELF